MSNSNTRVERRYLQRGAVALSAATLIAATLVAAILVIPAVLAPTLWFTSLRIASHPGENSGAEAGSAESFNRLVQSVETPAKGTFLVAAEGLMDPNFSKSVVLLIDYGEDGAFGIIINRPTEVKLSSAVPGMKGIDSRLDELYFGGPVARRRLMVLIRPDVPSAKTHPVTDDIHLTGDLVALLKIANTEGGEFRVYMGHAGWSPGQLDAEIARGDWLILPADGDTVFNRDPKLLWKKLTDKSRLRTVLRIGPVHSDTLTLDQG